MLMLNKRKRTETLVGMAGHTSRFRETVQRLARNKLALFGTLLVIIVVLSAIFADIIAPYDPALQDIPNKFSMPSGEHLLGTDNYGRDILSRIIFGGRVSLLVSLMGVVIALVAGGLLGAVAGYVGGVFEGVVMRLMDILMAVPGFLLAVSVSAAMGPGIVPSAIAVAVCGIPSYARIVRASVMTIKGQEFIEAATATGSSHLNIIFKQILPNILAPVIVDTTLRIGGNILMISSLSFIGLGVQPPTPEWGTMLADGRSYIRDFWPLVTFPGLAIMVTLFGFNLFGDGLRDALDPRLRQ